MGRSPQHSFPVAYGKQPIFKTAAEPHPPSPQPRGPPLPPESLSNYLSATEKSLFIRGESKDDKEKVFRRQPGRIKLMKGSNRVFPGAAVGGRRRRTAAVIHHSSLLPRNSLPMRYISRGWER